MLEKIKEIICQFVEISSDDINENSRFIEDLEFSSYDFMSFMGEIEDEFDIEVNEKDVINIKTVGEAIEYISSLKN